MYCARLKCPDSVFLRTFPSPRPIRRGRLFRNAKARKQSFFRHVREITAVVAFQRLELDYWTSASMSKGILVTVEGGLHFSGKYLMKQVRVEDNLIHRPREGGGRKEGRALQGATFFLSPGPRV